MTDLIKLLPEGASVIAVIIVIVLFLKQQRELAKDAKDSNLASAQKVEAISQSYQAHIDRMFEDLKVIRSNTEKIARDFFDKHVELSNENIKALHELKSCIENKLRSDN